MFKGFIMKNMDDFKLSNALLKRIIGGQRTGTTQYYTFSGENAVVEAQQAADYGCGCQCGCSSGAGGGGGSGQAEQN